jgi:hypothetical protein
MKNEIALLAARAHNLAHADEHALWAQNPSYESLFAEHFAKLLLKECIDVIKNESMGSTDEWENGLHIAVEAIEHNFGVKE